MTEFVVITGMSGAGRTTVANVLEDRGWFVIDNLPTSLVGKVVELAAAPGATHDRVALAVGPGAMIEDPQALLDPLEQGNGSVRLLFLDASTATLVRRYELTKRRHPMGGASLGDSIERERRLAEKLRERADVVIDTSDLSVHDIRQRVEDLLSTSLPGGMAVNLVTFGYKHGLPTDVDLVFDCRFLPNPHWDEGLREGTGLDPAVRDHAFDHPKAEPFLDRIEDLLKMLVPEYEAEGKAYLTIGVGCTGGHHRSVAVAEELGRRLEGDGIAHVVTHRDIDR